MPAPQKLGRYNIVDRLAVGGMAEIYIARAEGVQDFEKEYVLKLIHPKYVGDSDFIRMLCDEAKLTASLTHQNIAQVIDLDVDGDNYFIAMEYVKGKDLYQLLADAFEQRKRFPLDVAAWVASEIASGLNYAHNKVSPDGTPLNLVHRDISPQNVLISFEGEVKIVDFGVAKAAMGARPETQAGIIKGKFRYMSPEQAWGEKLDGRSDLFSAALCLYEMVTGMTAYEDTEDMRAMLLMMREAKVRDVREFRPDCDPRLIAIIEKGLAKSRHDRFASGRELQTALLEFVHTVSPGFHPGRLTDFMVELFPEDAAAHNVFLEHAQDVTGATMDLAPTEETTSDREAPKPIHLEPDADTDPQGDDLTVRRSYISKSDSPAPPPRPNPDDSFEAGETEVFQSQMGRPSPFADVEPGETSSMGNDNLLRLIEATSRPRLDPSGQHAGSSQADLGPGLTTRDRPVPNFSNSPSPRSGSGDAVEDFLKRSLPAKLADPAINLHKKIDASLAEDGAKKVVVPLLALAILFLLLAILVTILS